MTRKALPTFKNNCNVYHFLWVIQQTNVIPLISWLPPNVVQKHSCLSQVDKTIKQQQKHRSEFEHKNYRKMFPFSIYDKRD